MNLDDKYPSNTDKTRDEKPEKHEVQQITNKAEIREVSKARAVSGLFIKNDARSVGDAIVEDVLLPTVNDMITEGLHTAIDMFFVGGRNGRRSSGRRVSNGGASYADYYDDRNNSRRRRRNDRDDRVSYNRPRRGARGLIVDSNKNGDPLTRWEAEDILDEICRYIDDYGFCSVSDVYQMVGMRTDWTGDNNGWRSASGMTIEKLRGGGVELILPEPERY